MAEPSVANRMQRNAGGSTPPLSGRHTQKGLTDMPRQKPQVGQKVFRIVYTDERQPFMGCTNFVGQKGGWYTFRDLASGKEWKEQGLHWLPSEDTAFTAEFVRLVTTVNELILGVDDAEYAIWSKRLILLCNMPSVRALLDS